VRYADGLETMVSRVRESGDGVLVLTAPIDPQVPHGEPIIPTIGRRVVLSWGSATGAMKVSAVVIDTRRHPTPLWSVRFDEEPIHVQRRAFVRLAAHDRRLGLRANGRLVEVTLRDLSEGGLCATLPADKPLWSSQPVGVSLALEDGVLDLGAVVLRVVRADAWEKQAALRFQELTEADAARLRRHIFAEQARMRAARR
jgi:hypothetical protein